MRFNACAVAVMVGVLLAWCQPTLADNGTVYITDRLEVNLRRGTGTQYAIARTLQAGTELEVLERDAETGYTRVRAVDRGTEGWVLTRYLMDEPHAREQLTALNERLEQALAQRGSAGEMLDEMTVERDTLRTRADELRRSESQLRQELAEVRAAAADTLAVHDRNRTLSGEVEALEARVAALQLQNRDLGSQAQRDWFVAGAAVLLIGLVLGLVLPRIRWRRRSSWGDL